MGNIYSVSSDGSQGSHWATGRESGEVGRGSEWKTDKEEDRLILQGVNQKMRGRDGVRGGKAEIPSSGFFH